MRIDRHFEWTETHRSRFWEDVERFDMFLEGARKRSKNLYLFYTVAQPIFLKGSVEAPDSPEVSKAIRYSAQALSAVFAFSRLAQPPRYVTLGDGPPVTYSEASDKSHVEIINWERAFNLSVISRQSECLDLLHEVGYRLLMESSTGGGNEETYQYIELLKAVVSEKQFTRHPVFEKLEHRCRDGLGGKGPNSFLRYLTTPLLEVMRQLEKGKDDGFNQALDAALRGHKKYWSSSKTLRKDQAGLVSMPLTAMASLAHDRGINVTVDSDYMPMSWVTGDIFQK